MERDHLRRVVVDERAIFQQVLEEQFLKIWPQYILVIEGFSFVNFDCFRENFLISRVFSALNDPVPYCQSECCVFTKKKVSFWLPS
jgi:hypothetical protein